jgi:hypothetical protein
MLFLGSMLAVIVGISLIVVGYRGSRIGDQPVCQKCGFDLSGKPSASIHCGECGADLGEFGAVVYGHRRRRRGMLITGVVMLVFFGAPTASKLGAMTALQYAPFRWVAWRACSSDAELRNAAHEEMNRRVLRNSLTSENWNQLADAATAYRRQAPLAWDEDWDDLMQKAREDHHLTDDRWEGYVRALAQCAFGGKVWNQPVAFTELNRRTLDGLLSPTDLMIVEDELLACQADANKSWNSAWGDWLEDCQSKGQVDADRWQRYRQQSLLGAMSLRLRPKVRLGDPLPFVIKIGAIRAGHTVPTIHLAHVQLRWAGSSHPVEVVPDDSDLVFDWSRKARLVLAKELPSGLLPGTQCVHLNATIKSDRPKCQGVVTEPIDLPGSFELLPAAVSSVSTAQHHQTRLGPLIQFPPVVRVLGSEHRTVKCVVLVNDPPVGLAFDVVLKSGDKSQFVGSFACPAHADRNRYELVCPWRLGDADQVDVTLRSNPGAAVNTVDTIEIWNGDIPSAQVPVAFE